MTSSALEQEAVEQGATLIADVTHRWAYPDSYCYAEFPGGVDSVWATEEFIRMVEAYRNAMARLEPNAPVQPFPQERPQSRQEAPQRPRTNERRGKAKVNYGNCPDHPDVQAIPSKREYQEYDEVDGEQVPAKFFCPGDQNGTGQNHSLWRSQLIEVI